MTFLARFFSTVLHPLLMPSYIFGFVFVFLPELVSPIPPTLFPWLFAIILFTTSIMPGLVVFLMFKWGLVAQINIEDRTDRFVPHVISSLIYLTTTWLLYRSLNTVPAVYVLMLSMTACMVAVSGINFFWKISAHSTGMGGVVAFFIFSTPLFGYSYLIGVLVLSILLAGIVMAARMYLQVHTLLQVCCGFLLGLFIGLVALSNIS